MGDETNMELITAAEVTQRTGLSYATVHNYAKKGLFPTHEDSHGRRRFDANEIDQIVEREGIKPRPRKNSKETINGLTAEDEASLRSYDESTDQPAEDPEDLPPTPALPPDARDILEVALKRSRSAFRRAIKEEITRKLNDDEAPLDAENEIVALRFHMRADEVFRALREELVK